MVESGSHYHDSLITTDCLKAAGVFRRWKTFALLVVAVCLALQQASFYLLDQGYVKINDQVTSDQQIAADQAEEGNPVLQFLAKWLPLDSISKITFDRLAWTLNLVNFVLILAVPIYCLTLLLGLKVSLQGRLGGIKHITRAFILSLLMLVLLLPWQKAFSGIVVGAVFTPQEMLDGYLSKTEETADSVLYYFRFGGYSLLVFLLLMLSDLGSLFWAKATA
ncbi:MAG: hypothetical protein P8Z79_20290, partial [Sedimentisphaerales bacterium]